MAHLLIAFKRKDGLSLGGLLTPLARGTRPTRQADAPACAAMCKTTARPW